MKDDLKTTKKLCEGDKITLKDYYSNLPNATHPKTEFINEVIKKTGVSFTAPEFKQTMQQCRIHC